MHKYEIILYWSEEDKAFIAEVPELPGCMAEGTTYRYVKDRIPFLAVWYLLNRDICRGCEYYTKYRSCTQCRAQVKVST